MKINKVIIVINPTKSHARQTASVLRAFLDREKVRQEWIETLPPRKNLLRKLGDLCDRKVDLVIAVGGDGTLLQAAHRFRGSGLPLLGINIGYLGFITSVRGDRVRQEMKRVLNAELDGMTLAALTPGSTISVKTSNDCVPIAFLPEINYYDILTEKLKWRGDGLSRPRYGAARRAARNPDNS